VINPNRRPDLVLCNYRGNNKPTLVDFTNTSIPALSVDVIMDLGRVKVSLSRIKAI